MPIIPNPLDQPTASASILKRGSRAVMALACTCSTRRRRSRPLISSAFLLLRTRLSHAANEPANPVSIEPSRIKFIDSSSTLDGDVTLDVWSHKSDYRPAKIVAAVTTTQLGTFSVTMELKYDVAVTVDAPPADQVVSQ